MRERPSWSVIMGLLAGCGGHQSPARDDAGVDAAVVAIDAAVDGAGGYIRQPPVSIPPEGSSPDLTGYPVDDQGRPILAQGSNFYLVEREPDPLTALSSCTAMIVRCVDPAVRGRSLDACVISPARCATAQPWLEAPCCAAACVDRYEALRTGGTPPITAFRAAFYGAPSCAPGVDDLLEGRR